jgi:hypothetical protein
MIRRRLAAVVLLLALGALCGALASGRPARAEGEGEAGGIQGTLLNATTGLPAAGGAVTLYVQGGGSQAGAPGGGPGAEARETVADGEGRFAFAGAGAGARYQLTAVHQGVAYQTPVFALGELPAPLELRVYDVTGRDPGLRTERLLLTFGAVDAGRQEVAVTQLQTLVNPSPAAYRPETTGDPMGLLRFGLPPQATQLRPTLGLSPESLIQVDRGFASSDPVLPGVQEYAFAYRFPYVAPVYAFSLALPYGAASVRVLVPAGPGWALDVAGPDLAPLGEVDVGPRRYRVWGGRDVPPGGRLQVELRNLPPRPLWRAALDLGARPQVLAGAFAALLALAVGQALWQQRETERAALGLAAGVSPGGRGAPSRPYLLRRLAHLDDLHAAGRLPEGAYRQQRDLVLTRALEATPPGAGEAEP